MKHFIKTIVTVFIFTVFTTNIYAQKSDFSDREAVIKTVENFFIGDHTGDVKYKKLSMDKNGAYRYVNRNGEYKNGVFDLETGEADTSYKEEILSVEIYSKVALVRARLAEKNDKAHYKLFTLHKTNDGWKITTITWGFSINL